MQFFQKDGAVTAVIVQKYKAVGIQKNGAVGIQKNGAVFYQVDGKTKLIFCLNI